MIAVTALRLEMHTPVYNPEIDCDHSDSKALALLCQQPSLDSEVVLQRWED